MSTYPLSSFPLRASDQADVMRIFLELMQEKDSSGRTPEATAFGPLVQRNESDRMWFPGEMPGLV